MRLLIVGSLDGQIGAASKVALARGGQVVQADCAAQAMELLRSGSGADLALVEVKEDVARFIALLADERISLPVVACGGPDADSKAAVAAVRAGAREYIPLPPDVDLIGAVLTSVSLERHSLVWRDPAMEKVVSLIDRIAPSEASVLITGASGTGKEVVARCIHAKSRRSSGRFVALNCAAIPENLLESEMFGYEKGAFTGAVARRVGKFEEASGGTLLLDEISEMDVRLQAKLLRALQEREIDRVGGRAPVRVDVRILATSHRNLAEEVAAKRFREDLYFRLNVVSLALPPLRDRPADIVPLAEHFAAKCSEMNGVPLRPLSAAASRMLQDYDWPGNVRELENAMHRAVLLSTGAEMGPDAFAMEPDAERSAVSADSPMVGRTMASVERDLIIDTLKHTLGNSTHAATILGISLRTLRNKLRQYADEGFSVPQPGAAEA